MTGFATEATITIRALDQARGVIRGVRAELEGLKRAAGTAGANDNVARSMDRARGAVAATTAAVQGQSAALTAAGVAAGRMGGKIGEGFTGASRQVARLNSDLGAVAIRTGETTRIVSGIAKEYGVAANAARANDNVARSMDRARGAVAATTAAVQGQSAALTAAGVAAGRMGGKIGEGFTGASRQVARLNSDLGAVAIRTGETTRIVSGIAKEYGVAANAARAFAAASAVRSEPFRRFGGYAAGLRRPEAMSDEGKELRRALAGAAFMGNFSPSRMFGQVREAGAAAWGGVAAAAAAAAPPIRAVASSALSVGTSIAAGVGVGIAKLTILASKATVAGLAIGALVAAWKTISFIRGIGQAGQEWANTLERLRNGMNIPPDQMNRVTGAVRNLQTATGATANDAADLAIALSRAGTSTEDLASRSRLAHRLMTSLGSDAQTTATGLESTRRAWSLNNDELGAAADAIHAIQKATGQGSSVLENLNAMGERARESSLGVTGAARLLAAATEAGEGASGSAEAIGEMAARLTKAREESTKFRNGLRQLGLNANQVGEAMRVDATAGIMAFLAAVKRASDAGKDTDKILRDMFDTRQSASNVSNMASSVDRMAEAIRRAGQVPAGSLTRDTDAVYRNAENSAKRAQEAWRQLQSEMGTGSAAVDTFFKEMQAGLARHLADPNSGFAKWWSDQKLSFLQGLTGTRDLDVALKQMDEFWNKLKERGDATRAAFGDAGNFDGGFLATINRKAGEALAKLERILGIREMLARGKLGDRQEGPTGPFRPLKTTPIRGVRLAPSIAGLDPDDRRLMAPTERRELHDRALARYLMGLDRPSLGADDDARRRRDKATLDRTGGQFGRVMLPPGAPRELGRRMTSTEGQGQTFARAPSFSAPLPTDRGQIIQTPQSDPRRAGTPGGSEAPRSVRTTSIPGETPRAVLPAVPSPSIAPLSAPSTPYPSPAEVAAASRGGSSFLERLERAARVTPPTPAGEEPLRRLGAVLGYLMGMMRTQPPTPATAPQGAAAPASRVETPVNVQSSSQVSVTVTPQIDGIEARVRALVDQGKRDLEAAVARGQNDIRNAARGLGRLGGGSSGALGDGPRGGSN